MLPLARQVMRQTRARIFDGNARSSGKILSVFEPTTEVIRKGKAGKPNEFGKMVQEEATKMIINDLDPKVVAEIMQKRAVEIQKSN